MAKAIYTNNAAGQLAANIGASDTSILLGAGQGAKFPSPTGGDYFYATLVHASTGAIEIVKCTARAADTLTVVRGQDSTTAIAFTTSSVVGVRLTAQGLRDLDYRTVAGLANGVATLDATTRIPAAQMPTTVPIKVGGFIPDTDLNVTIARQTAVDAKVAKAGDTMTGALTINRATNVAEAAVDMIVQNGAYAAQLRARSSAASLNPLVQANDILLLFNANAIDAACAMVIGPWSTTNKGLRIDSTGGFTCNGNNVWHAGNFTLASKLDTASPAFTGNLTGPNMQLTGSGRFDGGFLYLNNAQTRSLQWDNAAGWYKLALGSGLEAVNFRGTSDRRLKANVVYRMADPFLADKLGIVDFLWKHNGDKGTGVIAQDVKRVASQYVSNTGKHYAVDHAGLALEAVVGLADRVRQLEAKADTTCSTPTPKTRKSSSSTTRSRSCSAPSSQAAKSPRTSR